MFQGTNPFAKRVSVNNSPSVKEKNMKKPSAPNTPQNSTPAVKIQSEQKQSGNKNKNKRKSLPANVTNGGNSATPKKQKIESFLGTSDLFLETQEPQTGNSPAEKASPKKDKKQKGQNKVGEDGRSRKETLKANRAVAKGKLKNALGEVVAGNQDAVNKFKDILSKIESKDALSRSAKRKAAKIRSALKAAGVEIPRSAVKTVVANQQKQKGGKQTKQVAGKGGNQNKGSEQAGGKKKNAKPGKVQNVKADDEEEDGGDAKVQQQKRSILQVKPEESDTEESDDVEEEEDEDDSDDDNFIDKESVEEEEGSDDEDDDDDDDDEESEEDEDDNAPAQKQGGKPQNKSDVSALGNAKSRYVVFVGNLPFDITKEEISQHFAKISDIKDVRIPLDKQTNKCRGFAYVELADQVAYEKALSLHHTNMKGRRINVMYTQGGKKKGEGKKQEIKAKNFKLQAMRQQGKLAGGVNQSQKRNFRREKQQHNKSK